ncbi:RDD family protein [Pseudomarimonas arenosa]|uniref:RDD family protein n=1 Tax=Pseudomarimonas arenosa TaxID=2774145 RepID=UPI002FC33D90
MLLDTEHRVETPEGVALRLHPAGVMSRAVAWAIDFVVRLSALMIGSMVLGFLGKTGAGLTLILLFLIYWLYPILFEVLRNGQTIGKRAMGLRVVHANGTPVGWLASFLRNLLRTVDMLPVLYGFGVLASLADPQCRRLGDRVAGTLVVHEPKPPVKTVLPTLQATHPPLALSLSEKQAIIDFAERSPGLTLERQEELAELLQPMIERRGPGAVRHLHAMAATLMGRAEAGA